MTDDPMNPKKSMTPHKLAESALKERMAAKHRTFVVAVGLAEDRARKLLLSDAQRTTEALEHDITRAFSDALRNFEGIASQSEQAAYMLELEWVAEAQRLRDADEISQQQFEQRVKSINAQTDRVMAGVHETMREILASMRARFNSALRQSGETA
jgi:hypothetical protein